jgi:rRNA-processing protein FCF1
MGLLKVRWFLLSKRGLLVVLDTSILMLAVEHRIDLFGEISRLIPMAHKCVLITSVYNELNNMINSKASKEKLLTRVALKMADNCEIVNFEEVKSADDSILEFAKRNLGNVIVATNDAELRRKLRMLSIPVIYVRDFNHLEMDGEVSW